MTSPDDAALVAELRRLSPEHEWTPVPGRRGGEMCDDCKWARRGHDDLIADIRRAREFLTLKIEVLSLRRVRDAAVEYRREQEAPVKDYGYVANRRVNLFAALDADAARGQA